MEKHHFHLNPQAGEKEETCPSLKITFKTPTQDPCPVLVIFDRRIGFLGEKIYYCPILHYMELE